MNENQYTKKGNNVRRKKSMDKLKLISLENGM